MCWLIRGGVSGHVKGQLTAANFPLQAARGARVSEPKFSPQHRAWHFEGGELGRGGGRRKSLADLDFRVIAKETRPGEKLFGFLRFFISRCASNLCGQNGSGRAGRLWYTRSPAKTLGEALVRAADRAPVRGTMPCIVYGAANRRRVVEARLRPTAALPSAGQAKAWTDRGSSNQPLRSFTIRKQFAWLDGAKIRLQGWYLR
jgi:hypothetical protein